MCAAIEAGGIVLQRAAEARNYGQSLKAAGFKETMPPGTPFRAGDVVIIQGASSIKEGHMAMFNGSVWVSDYKQSAAVYPGGAFDREKPSYRIYRHPDAAGGSGAAGTTIRNAGIKGKLFSVGQTHRSVSALTKVRYQKLKYQRECQNVTRELPIGTEFEVRAIALVPQSSLVLQGKLANAAVRLKLSFDEFEKMFMSQVAAGAQKALAANMQISTKGMKFLFKWESQAGVSNRLHWPGGSSGVTLGAGYDMKGRKSETVKADMIAIGIPATTAEKIGAGAGLSGIEAQKFCTTNKALVSLSADAETALLKLALPTYEKNIRSGVSITLHQHEYDALVAFCYNIPSGAKAVAKLLNSGSAPEALKEWSLYVNSGGKKVQGLINRRNSEIALFTKASY